MYEGHFQESSEVLGGFLEPGEDVTMSSRTKRLRTANRLQELTIG
jgi:hypothetical protein